MTGDIQQISIVSTQTVPKPKPHTTYTVQVQTPIRTWTVDRRYNDFVALHNELVSSTGKEPPALMPSKHPFSFTRSAYDDKIVRERRVLLETYLRAILTAKSPVWRESYTYQDFLSVPSHTKPNAGPGYDSSVHWTPANWLTERNATQATLRNTRSELLKRDALAGMGDAAASRGAGVGAKRLLREVGEQIDVLARGLESISASVGDGERRRREEMVDALRGERADLMRMAEAGVRTARQAFMSTSNSTASGGMPGGNSLLFGTLGAAPGPGRVFGRKAEETEETRPLDDRGLLQLHQTKIGGQDEQLKELSKILARQRGMGEEIHREIGEQTEMLEDIEARVDQTGSKMARAKREMNRLR